MRLQLLDLYREDLLPLTFTRPAAELRVGIQTIREKWEDAMNATATHLTVDYLQAKFPAATDPGEWYICGNLLPNEELVDRILELDEGVALVQGDVLLAIRSEKALDLSVDPDVLPIVEYADEVDMVVHPYDVFRLNAQEIGRDFELLSEAGESAQLSSSNTLIGQDIYIEKGARVEASVLNASNGPIYIGKDAEIMEGSLIRGPFSLGEHATIKMGSKIYGGTTVGPHCKVGGEVNNVVFQGYSNKGHDGFLGNAVIGEWCNIGADSNCSNLKNNYAEVKVWNYPSGRFKPSGLQFCGLIMGDHSKCGINTMFNTGTVVGVSANIFGSGFPRNFVPSFSWGGSGGFSTYSLRKAFDTAELVMQRRELQLDEIEKNILRHIFERTAPYRVWDNKTE